LGSWFSSKCKTTFHGTEIPFTIPKTGYPSDETGKIVAENVLEPSMEEPTLKKNLGGITGLCIMDAGKKEVIIVSDTLFKPRKFAIMLPNILFDINKVSSKNISFGN
jgi:sulfide:quinone oxidoreductase